MRGHTWKMRNMKKILAWMVMGIGSGDYLNYRENKTKSRSFINVQYSIALLAVGLEFSAHLCVSWGTPQSVSPPNPLPNPPGKESLKLAVVFKFPLSPWKGPGRKRANRGFRCLK